MWVYHSPIGNLFIRRLDDGSYGFEYDGTVWESSPSPEIEADNAFMHVTGCYEWDKLAGQVDGVPDTIGGWEKLT